MNTKTCSVCGELKKETAFYPGNRKCKPCYIAQVKANQTADKRRAYEKARNASQERVTARAAYMKTPEGKAAHAKAVNKWRSANKHKLAAHNAVARALFKGLLERKKCEECGDQKSEAHHDDYAKPLDVRWLCAACHSLHHRQSRE